MNLNIAVLGCGYWGKHLVRNFQALSAVRMVCDPVASGRATAHELAPDAVITDSFEIVMEDRSVTAVAIAAPAVMHGSLCRTALLAGKDVFVEKPLCLDVREAVELSKLANQQGRVLMVGHLLQYHPYVQKLQSLLASGQLGKLHYLISNRLNLGKIRREENALWSFAPHDVSVILSLANSQLPDRVVCTGGSYLTHGIADTTLTTMNFADGVRAHIFVSWLNPFKEQKLTVVGSSGMAVFDDTKPWAEKLVVFRDYLVWKDGQVATPTKATPEPIIMPESEPLRNECAHFLDCCRSRQNPRTDAAEGTRVLAVLQAAQLSLDRQSESFSPAALLAAPANLYGSHEYFVHPTAQVDEGAIIGRGTKIWHYSHIMKGAQIGEGCSFGQNVNVDGGTVIGNNVKVQNNVSIYAGLEIEDDVFLGPSCVLTNVSNPRSQILRHSLYEKTRIKRGATIGANATIVCGITLGRYCFVAAGSVVTKDVPDYALMVGNPARQKGWMSRHGHVLKPIADGTMQCPESGLRYREQTPGFLQCIDLPEDSPLPKAQAVGHVGYRDVKYGMGGARSGSA